MNFFTSVRARREAFTLLEILIVISIITMVSLMGAGSYKLARRGIAIDLQGDKIVVLLNQYRDLSKFRDTSKESSTCHGLYFKKGEMPQKVEAPYNPATRTCSDQTTTTLLSDWPSDIVVNTLESDILPLEQATIFFSPPRGRMIFDNNAQSAHEIRATITFHGGASTALRSIVINRDTGTVEKRK